MDNFKIGDKVIMKDNITGEDIQELGIRKGKIDEVKERMYIVENAWTDDVNDVEIDVIEFKDSEFIWETQWFRYYSTLPEELFKIG